MYGGIWMSDRQALTFEEAMKKLETIVHKLEQEDVPLEKAINYYQEGMELSKVCNDILKNAQEKMTNILIENGEVASFEIQGD